MARNKRKSNNFVWVKSVIALFVICCIAKIMTQLDIYLIAASVVILIFSLAIYYHQKYEHEREEFIRSNKKIIDFNNFQYTPRIRKFNALKLEQLRKMNPFAFEEYIAWCYRCLGFVDAHATKATADGGKDIQFHNTEGKLCYLECKKYKNGIVTRPQVQKLVGAALADQAIPYGIITTGRFTKEATEEAKKTGVRCIGPTELMDMIERAEKTDQESGKKRAHTHTV